MFVCAFVCIIFADTLTFLFCSITSTSDLRPKRGPRPWSSLVLCRRLALVLTPFYPSPPAYHTLMLNRHAGG
jgi:hypothetical protein